MYTTTPLLLLLALPTFLTASPLEPRYNHGFIGSWTTGDCSGDNIEDKHDPTVRPKLVNGGCVPFHPRSNNLGINFGSGTYTFEELRFYSDGECKNLSGVPAAVCPNQFGPGSACIHPSVYRGAGSPGNAIGSVNAYSGHGNDAKWGGGY